MIQNVREEIVMILQKRTETQGRDRQKDRQLQTDRPTDTQTNRQTNRQTHTQTNRQTDRHTDTQTDRKIDSYRQTDRQVNRHADIQTHTRTDTHTHTQYISLLESLSPDLAQQHAWPNPEKKDTKKKIKIQNSRGSEMASGKVDADEIYKN